MTTEHAFAGSVFADCCMITLADGRGFVPEGDPEWIEQLLPPGLLATEAGAVAVGTVRESDVPVTVDVLPAPPTGIDEDSVDQIAETFLDVRSGTLVLMGISDAPWRAPRISIAPGRYYVDVFYSGLDTISTDGLTGNDHYHLALWPDPECRPTRIRKQHPVQ